MQRLIIEMGMGVDLHGQDDTKAARRALEDALRHAALPVLSRVPEDRIEVQVTIGAQRPEKVDCAALKDLLPRGRVTVTAVPGGLDVTDPDTGSVQVVASAAVEVFLPRPLPEA
ncbi:Lin0512 family protein [Aestuariicoccus sp. MJ-SS9]|uniref:Lin0512 family protein n=1 Tax=Aestuariicoccus sp. MJ-SS9 TaxID=3079855 RepID=UPI0029109664|nr:Lin0512 family protein [Aestuariicoccus sp. MJ-SS9]MDU8911540.1 Lin0512 family protein [Aestuariicoccus sp. MJ-SS9]